MAVITPLDGETLAEALEAWDAGVLRAFAPTPLGIENTNYMVTTMDAAGRRHEWVLTLMEQDVSPLALDVVARLGRDGLPVAVPLTTRQGGLLHEVAGRTALLTPRLGGDHPMNPTTEQCAAIGRFLGRMHQALAGMDAPPHPRDLVWLHGIASSVRMRLGFHAREQLDRALEIVTDCERRDDYHALPVGIVHGDLFRDNALFNPWGLCGVLDFHHAAGAPLVFDLAVVANDWCTTWTGELDRDRVRALLRGYEGFRELEERERWYWPCMLILAALRFWLARLSATVGPGKNPGEMERILAERLFRLHYLHRHAA